MGQECSILVTSSPAPPWCCWRGGWRGRGGGRRHLCRMRESSSPSGWGRAEDCIALIRGTDTEQTLASLCAEAFHVGRVEGHPKDNHTLPGWHDRHEVIVPVAHVVDRDS